MKLKNVLALSYTITFTVVIGIALSSIYFISEKYRKDEFSQRLKDRTLTTFKILLQVEQIDNKMLQLFDRNTINNLYEEKILLFDSDGDFIYSSIDDTYVSLSKDIIARLKTGVNSITTTEGKFEVIGIRFVNDGETYYGVAKAFDKYGRSKLLFLKYLLIGTFIVIATLLIFLSFILSRKITAPITRLTANIEKISLDDLSVRVPVLRSTQEVGFLTTKFNELLDKVENAFKFQHHFIHHISHELKTPLAVMMANAERALTEGSTDAYKSSLKFQKNALMELSHIINAMLDLSKTENQLLNVLSDQIRMDELLFECMEEINFLNNQVHFDFKMSDQINSSEELTVSGNHRMLKMALMNLLKNAVNYSAAVNPVVELAPFSDTIQVNILNDGETLSAEEQKQLFKYLFRGKNSRNIKGFGLGLVLTQRIITLHNGTLNYFVTDKQQNCFSLSFPTFS